MNALEKLIDYCIKHAPVLMSHARTIEKLLDAVRNDKPTCKTCFYFSPSGTYPRRGTCEHPIISPGRDVTVQILNGIGYYDVEAGSIYMGEDFGCIHHESAA